MGFVRNLHLFPTVKEFWKSVKNWQSYRHEFGVLLLLGQCISNCIITGMLCLMLNCYLQVLSIPIVFVSYSLIIAQLN